MTDTVEQKDSLWLYFKCWWKTRHYPRHYVRTLKTLVIYECDRCGFHIAIPRSDYWRDL